MILDAENLFCREQAVTATAQAANVIDLGRGDAGPSEGLSLLVMAAGFTSGSLNLELQTAESLNGNALESPVKVVSYPVDAAKLTAGGKLVAARLPQGLKRYLGLAFTVPADGTAPAGGKITAGLVLNVEAEA